MFQPTPRSLAPSDVAPLRAALHGSVMLPDDEGYHAARAVWNGMVDRRPAVIAGCRNAADVCAAVSFAVRHRLVVAVRAGGHNVAGYATCDGGLVVDMGPMNGVRVAPDLRRAWVEGGATWRDVDAATTPFGRATPGGLVSATGVAGLTLSGGIGWLRGRHGLACDNLLAADIVTADGRLLHASPAENADLLWALRGGGGNFGIVTGFEFGLHAVAPELFFCAPAFPEEHASEILALWRDFMDTAPEGLSGLAEFSTVPRDPAYPQAAWGRRVVALAHVYDGPADEGERITAPLRAWGSTVLDFSCRLPYRDIQMLYDGLFPKGRDRCYWKSCYLRGLDAGAIATIAAHLATRPSDMSFVSVWRFGGAIQRVPADATAFGDRSAPFMLSIDAIWSQAGDDDANMRWARQFWHGMQAHSTGRMYLNFPGLGEGENLVRDAFGAQTYRQLQQVKRKFDPENVFRMNQNILPEA